MRKPTPVRPLLVCLSTGLALAALSLPGCRPAGSSKGAQGPRRVLIQPTPLTPVPALAAPTRVDLVTCAEGSLQPFEASDPGQAKAALDERGQATITLSAGSSLRLLNLPQAPWNEARVFFAAAPPAVRVDLQRKNKILQRSTEKEQRAEEDQAVLACSLPIGERADALAIRVPPGGEPVLVRAVEFRLEDPLAKWPAPGSFDWCRVGLEERYATTLFGASPLRASLRADGGCQLHLGWSQVPALAGPAAMLEIRLWAAGQPPESHEVRLDPAQSSKPGWDGVVLPIPDAFTGKDLSLSLRLIPEGLGACAALLEVPRLLRSPGGGGAVLFTVDGLHSATIMTPGSAPLVENAKDSRREVQVAGLEPAAALASIFTAESLSVHRVKNEKTPMARGLTTLAEELRDQGLRTVALLEEGSLTRGSRLLEGFDRVIWLPEGSPPSAMPFALEGLLSKGDGGPIFLWMETSHPCPPYRPLAHSVRLLPLDPRSKKEPLAENQRPSWDKTLDDGRVVRNLHRAEFSEVERTLNRLLAAPGLRGATWVIAGLRGQNLGAENLWYEMETPSRALLTTAIACGGSKGKEVFGRLSEDAASLGGALIRGLGFEPKALGSGPAAGRLHLIDRGRVACLFQPEGVLSIALYAGEKAPRQAHEERWVGEARSKAERTASRKALLAALAREGLEGLESCTCERCAAHKD